MIRVLAGADGQRYKGEERANRNFRRLLFSIFPSVRWISWVGDPPRDVRPHHELRERLPPDSPDGRLLRPFGRISFFCPQRFPDYGLIASRTIAERKCRPQKVLHTACSPAGPGIIGLFTRRDSAALVWVG